mmetsp:Transcript_36346/g.66811  ORF Transcript_36346/g.66811 Transcript_36346/m.66811 type:complete len:675 (+) Transcript_36346:99-2123(+)
MMEQPMTSSAGGNYNREGADSGGGSVAADDSRERHRQVNPFSLSGSATTDGSGERYRQAKVNPPSLHDSDGSGERYGQVNPNSHLESGENYCRGTAYDIGEEINGFSETGNNIQLHGIYLRENVASVDEENININPKVGSNAATVQQTKSNTPSRKKVKNRHCKAAIMVCVVWSITVTLISIALGMDWFNEGLYTSDDDANLCTLCGDNGLDFIFDKTSMLPTRQPSPSKATLPFNTIDPPPANLAELCAPSIRLHPGLHLNGPFTGDLVENCIKACLPAACCLVNNEKAQEGLLSILGSQEVGDNHASAYLSTVKDCHPSQSNGDDISVCEAYNEWCATLYSLDSVLEKSLPAHFFDTCYRNQEDEEDIIIATSRTYNPVNGDCGELCRPLACCYDDRHESKNHVIRKRDRQHKYYEDGKTIILEAESGRRVEEEECQHFKAQGPLNTQICDAYAPFCSPYENSLASTLVNRPYEPSGAPNKLQSLKPNIQSSKRPSTSPSSTAPSTSPDPTFQPSEANNISASLSLIFDLHPTSNPSSIPTSHPSLEQTISFPPSNENYSSSFTPSSSSSLTPTNSPSFQPSTTNFPSGTPSVTNQPTANLFVTPTPSTSSSMNKQLPTQQPSSSETPTGDSRNATLHLSVSPSAEPSVSPSSEDENTPSMEPTQVSNSNLP